MSQAPSKEDRPSSTGEASGEATSTVKALSTPSGSGSAGSRGTYVPTFNPEDVVAGRYRVVRYIARGGMGEVYEVEDLDLKGRVALKTVRAEMAVDQGAIERFKREIHLARKVSHPNVCRIFDLGRHHLPPAAPGGAESEVLFLTMELLDGETLSERIKRTGRLTVEEALPIVSQMAAALATAHEADIVHRDFKSANVMLVPGKGGDRAVVTDFGIARGAVDGAHFATMTGTGDILGTPAYMAPEQVEGGKVTAAADIYALGVVLFEMVTGQRPFGGDSPFSIAVKHIREKPPSPRHLESDLPPVWESVILRCLEKEPHDRFARADDVVRALEGEAVARPRRSLLRRRAGVGAVIAAALGLLIWLAPWRWGWPAPTPAAGASPTSQAGVPAATERPAVAVVGFRNLGRPDADWLSTAISEMLRTELAAGDKIRTVPGESVARMKLELGLAAADSLAPDTLARIHGLIGADFVVLGSYLSLGQGKLRIDLRLQDSNRGELLTSSAAEGTEEGLFQVVSQAGRKLREALALGDVSAGDAVAARASFPANPEAAQLYAEGIARLRVFDAREARALLEKAAAREPSHPLVRAALAGAWSALGYDGKARNESKQAVELAADLPRAERLEVQALHAELSGDWEKASELYRALLVFFPGRIDYGLRLAAAQVAGGKAKEALESVEALRSLREPERNDPRIDLAEAGAAKALTDFERQRRASADAATKAQQQGAVLLFAQARLGEASALVNLGKLDEARRAAAQARELFAASGDLGNAARARNVTAVSFAMRGQFAEARTLFQAALEEFRRIGDQRGIATQLENVAGAELRLGRPAKARALFAQALAVAREIGDVGLAARTLSNLATTLEESGDLDGALRRNEESLAAWREIGAVANEAVTLANIGEVRFKKKQLDLARQRFEESLGVARKAGIRNEDTAWAYGRLAAVLVAQGQFAAAETALGDAIAIYRAAGATVEEAQSLRTLSDVRIRRGNAAGAREAAAEADKLEKAAKKE